MTDEAMSTTASTTKPGTEKPSDDGKHKDDKAKDDKAKDDKAKDDKAFFLAQRDKHLAQFMEINAKAVFAVLGIVFSAFVGVGKMEKIGNRFCLYAIGFFLAFGIVLLAVAAVKMAMFHTAKIRDFETLSALPEPPAPELKHYRILPPGCPNVYVFVGIMSLVCAATVMIMYQLIWGNTSASTATNAAHTPSTGSSAKLDAGVQGSP